MCCGAGGSSVDQHNCRKWPVRGHLVISAVSQGVGQCSMWCLQWQNSRIPPTSLRSLPPKMRWMKVVEASSGGGLGLMCLRKASCMASSTHRRYSWASSWRPRRNLGWRDRGQEGWWCAAGPKLSRTQLLPRRACQAAQPVCCQQEIKAVNKGQQLAVSV